MKIEPALVPATYLNEEMRTTKRAQTNSEMTDSQPLSPHFSTTRRDQTAQTANVIKTHTAPQSLLW